MEPVNGKPPTATRLHQKALPKQNSPDESVRDAVRRLTEHHGPPDSLLAIAQRTVTEREETYGPPETHWGKAAEIANILYDLDLDADLWGRLWVIDKLVRDSHLNKRDNLLDIAGYIDGVDRVRGRK